MMVMLRWRKKRIQLAIKSRRKMTGVQRSVLDIAADIGVEGVYDNELKLIREAKDNVSIVDDTPEGAKQQLHAMVESMKQLAQCTESQKVSLYKYIESMANPDKAIAGGLVAMSGMVKAVS